MTTNTLTALLDESFARIPETLAAVCTDLRTGNILASQTSLEEPGTVDALAQAASQLFARHERSAIDRLWSSLGDGQRPSDEIILIEPDRCMILLRAATAPDCVIVFLTGRTGDVGLTIARSRTVKTNFEEALGRV